MWTETLATSAKYGPSLLATTTVVAIEQVPYLPDIWTLVASGLGLIFGAMWRVGYLREEYKADWKSVGDDFLNSIFTGGANAALTLALIDWLEGGILIALAVGALVGATGVRAILWAQRFVIGHLEQKFGGPGDGR